MSVACGSLAAVIPTVDVATLRKLFSQPAEIALLDVREQGVQARDGHILRSAGLALSQLELRAATLLPRLGAPLVITDGGDEILARRAAKILHALGYSDVRILAGGVAAWQAAGGELFTGTSALSKGFGEFVEQQYGTPHLSATELKRRVAAGEDILLVDGRTLAEFEDFSIPGALACPNGELVHRIHPLLGSERTTVVVNCAGRTRSIIGAQTLINAGLSNPVLALENGTMDWLVEGFELQHGVQAAAPRPQSREAARATAAGLIERYGIVQIDLPTLGEYRRQAHQRTLYLYDVRTRAEYEAGHLSGARWAEGGQLVQGVDNFVGVQHSRLVLVDDSDGLRAAVAASWLVQIGWSDVAILKVDPAHASAVGPDSPPLWQAAPSNTAWVSAQELAQLLKASPHAVVLDMDTSLAYRAGHIPGAWFAVRAQLDQRVDELPGNGPIVLTSSDGLLARFAASEVAALSKRPVQVLRGGTQAWKAAGLALEAGEKRLWDDADDVWRSPYKVAGDQHAAFRQYLDWELGLVAQLQRDGTARFKTFG